MRLFAVTAFWLLADVASLEGTRDGFSVDGLASGLAGDNLYPMIVVIVVQGLASLIATFDVKGINAVNLSNATKRIRLAEKINQDWNTTTQATTNLRGGGPIVVHNPNRLDAAGRCKEKLRELEIHHGCKKAGEKCEDKKREPGAALQAEMRVQLTTGKMDTRDKTDWYGPGYLAREFGLEDRTSVVHRAGLLGVINGEGQYFYICSSSTAVCSGLGAQCSTSSLILGGADTDESLKWTEPKDFNGFMNSVGIPASQ